MSFEWTELAYQEIKSGNTMLLIFPLCVLLVYLVLIGVACYLFFPGIAELPKA